ADGKQFYSMNQADVIESFYPIRQDYTSLCHAQYILEICEKTIPDRTPCDDLLRLLLKTLQHISGKNTASDAKITGRQAVCVFLFRFFLFYGLAPEMNACCICGDELSSTATIFCDEGMACFNCQKNSNKAYMPLSLAAQEAIRHMLSADINRAFMFRIQDAVLNELALASQLCWQGHFPIPLQTSSLLDIQ
ncbi:MAG: DNA repair protein RecO, partial [Defluviitaleaceae bacterium]|nr:DNA repair protein RecO [Defluviitaleaceae bacterium]